MYLHTKYTIYIFNLCNKLKRYLANNKRIYDCKIKMNIRINCINLNKSIDLSV